MNLREKFDSRRLFNGALLLCALVLAWKFDRSPATNAPKQAPPANPPATAGSVPPSIVRMPWSWWRAVAVETYEAMNKDRLLAVAAGVVFYALLAIFPAITAFVSSYGLFANPSTIQKQLSLLSNVMPSGGIDIVREQIERMVAQPRGLSLGFVFGFLVALWSANAGVKAIIDALNVIERRDEGRSFVRLNLLALAFTVSGLIFLLLAVGAVVAFPLAMSSFGLGNIIGGATGLLRWPLLYVLVVLALTMLYRFAPDRPAPRGPWFSFGAFVGAILWLAGSALLSLYLSNFADYNATYGSLGAAIGLMMWMWISTIAVLLGAQIDTVVNRKRRAAA